MTKLSPLFTPVVDVDLTHGPEGPPRSMSYPAPPTGHELMALFPPAPPATLDMKPGSTSGYFRREERAFFAQGDKEIVRVRLDMDSPQGPDRKNGHDKGKGREPLGNQDAGHRPFLPQVAAPAQTSNMAPVITQSNTRPPRGPPVPVPSSSFQQSPHGQHLPLNSHQHGPHSSPHDATYSGASVTKTELLPDDDPDDAWRRPMPYAERRRAGKHTKRVIVRN